MPEPSDIIWHQRLDLDVSLRVVLARGCLDSEPGIEAFASDIDKAEIGTVTYINKGYCPHTVCVLNTDVLFLFFSTFNTLSVTF